MTYIIVLVLLVLSGVLYLKIADKYNIIDKPNQRSSHTVPVIRGGGILFVIAILIFFIQKMEYPYFVMGTLLIATVSFIDDLKTLSSKVRFPFQIVAILFLLFQIYGFTMPFWYILLLSIAGLGCINFYNFMDGINGITGVYSFTVLVSLFYVNIQNQIISTDLYIYQFIAIAVFGFYNFRKKARCFAGDIGSISLAMLVFFTLMSSINVLKAPLLLMFLGVYGADSMSTFFYRLLVLKENVGEPHRHHIYQKLVDICKFSHLKVAILYSLLQVLISFIVVFTYHLTLDKQWLIILLLAFVLLLIYILIFKYIDKRKSK